MKWPFTWPWRAPSAVSRHWLGTQRRDECRVGFEGVRRFLSSEQPNDEVRRRMDVWTAAQAAARARRERSS